MSLIIYYFCNTSNFSNSHEVWSVLFKIHFCFINIIFQKRVVFVVCYCKHNLHALLFPWCMTACIYTYIYICISLFLKLLLPYNSAVCWFCCCLLNLFRHYFVCQACCCLYRLFSCCCKLQAQCFVIHALLWCRAHFNLFLSIFILP
jgi:hypothetical protein